MPANLNRIAGITLAAAALYRKAEVESSAATKELTGNGDHDGTCGATSP